MDQIKAIYALSPRVKLGKIAELDDIVSLIMGRTGFNEGAVLNMLTEFRNAVLFYVMSGRPVRFKGLGIFAPKINKKGDFGINYKIDRGLKSDMNVPKKFKGDVINSDMIGASIEEIVERWNRENPDQPIEI